MEHDVGWKGFLSDDQRYADVINGFACGGCQVVKENDLQELDTQTGFLKATGFALSLRKTDAKEATGRKLRSKLGRKIWLRDMIRRVVYIPTRQSTLHDVLVHSFRRYSARFPVISA